jgi:fibronectin type 3 domain-containing protein
MKKCFWVIFVGFLVMLPGCSDPNGKEDEKDPPLPGTYIRFTNKNDFSVSLYTDSFRQVKLVDVAADAEEIIETSPNSDAVFYPTHHTTIDGIEFSYEADGFLYRVDDQKTTDIAIPLLTELNEPDLEKSITVDVYLKLQNAGSTALVLKHGNYPETPQGWQVSLVNGGETVVYKVAASPVSSYSFLKYGTTPVDFPPNLTQFSSGHLYLLKFDGTAFTLTADKPITIKQILQTNPPENLRATSLENGHISLVWDKAGTENTYGIYRSNSAAGDYTIIGTAAATSFVDETVTIGSTYYYRLNSIKGKIESPLSNTVVSIKSEVFLLPPPLGLTVDGQTTDSLSLSWYPVPEAVNYTLYKGSTAGAVNGYVATLSSTSYTVTGLMPGTTYYFAVSSVSGNGESPPSAAVAGTTTEAAPLAPTGLRVTNLMAGNVSLSWNSVTKASSYKVFRSSSKEGVPMQLVTTEGTIYTDSSVAEGTAYYYSVQAVNSAGGSPYSEQAFAVAALHSPLPAYAELTYRDLFPGESHYYRFPVSAEQSYSIKYYDYVPNNIVCSAWQNDGSSVFLNASSGSFPREFTASIPGYVTVEVKNTSSYSYYYSSSYNIYYEPN